MQHHVYVSSTFGVKTLCIVIAMCCGSTLAQRTGAASNSRRTSTVYGVCIYITNDTAYYSNVFAMPGSSSYQAQSAFRQYATSQAKGAPLKGATCRWAASQDQAAALKAQEKQLLGTAGHSAKGVETGWQYTPSSVAAVPAPAIATVSTASVPGRRGAPVPTSSPARATVTPAASQSPGSRATSITGSPTTSSGTSIATAGTGTATAGTGLSSIGTNARQTVQGAQASTTAAVSSSVNDMTTSTVNGMTTAATGAMQNFQNRLFHKKKPEQTPTATTAGVTPAVNVASVSAPVPIPASSPAQVSTPGNPISQPAATPDSASSGVGFLFCHLKANGSEYYSDIFPATASDLNPATMAFWRQVAHQYKMSSVPFRDNVACVGGPNEQEAIASRKNFIDTAPQRGLSAGHMVDTGWMYMGETK